MVELDLADEERIVWLEHPETLAYVRERSIWHNQRRGRPGRHRVPGRLVGYAVLRPDARREPGHFAYGRRVWWVADDDPHASGWPTTAVDPCSIRPRQPSRRPA